MGLVTRRLPRETRAAALLINTLRTNLPQLRLLLTHSTATGRARGRQKLLLPDDVQVWLPWDTPAAVRRFLQQFQPLVGVLMGPKSGPTWSPAASGRACPWC